MRRRDFLKNLPVGLTGTALPITFGPRNARAILQSPILESLVNPTSQPDRIVVVVWLAGGNDGLNTVIPFADPRYDKLRPNTGYCSSEDKSLLVHKLRGDLALNPAMSSLYPLWQEGKIAVVQNLGMQNNDLSHFRAADIWNSASDSDLLEPTGWVARWLELEYPEYPEDLPDDPLAISVGPLSSSIFQSHRGQMDILIQDPENYLPVGATSFGPNLDTYGGKELRFVRDLIGISDKYSHRFQKAFEKEKPHKVDYPKTEIGDSFSSIARSITAGLKTRVYFTMLNGFDTHANQFGKDPALPGQAKLLKELADAMTAFQRDLEAMGEAERVITMTYSEFGRRTFENGSWSSGTDHGTAAPHFVMGSGVNGELYGQHPNLIDVDKNGDPFLEFEFRNLYASVLGDWFGVSEKLRTAVLSPGREHSPFATDFQVNGSNRKQSLIRYRNSPSVGGEETIYLSGSHPNPFSLETTIRFNVSQASYVEVEVFDTRGVLVEKVAAGSFGRGEHEAVFRPRSLVAGSYFYRIKANGELKTGSMVYLP